MSAVALWRVALIAIPIAIIEVLCRSGVIDRITLPPPSIIVADLVKLLASGRVNGALIKTLTNVAIAIVASLAAGVAAGVLIHRLPPLGVL